jgi:hypothetical protein
MDTGRPELNLSLQDRGWLLRGCAGQSRVHSSSDGEIGMIPRIQSCFTADTLLFINLRRRTRRANEANMHLVRTGGFQDRHGVHPYGFHPMEVLF